MKWLQYLPATIAGLLLFSSVSRAQPRAHSFEQVGLLQKNAKRNTVVFIYTDWCRYCQVMKASVLSKEPIVGILNDRFYFVSLNAEEKKDIRFNNRLFKYRPNGTNTGTHDLAQALASIGGKVSYPVLVILNSEYEIIFQYSGFLNTKVLRAVLYNTPQ